MSYNINNSDNIDVKTGIHKEHINQYTSPSSLSSQKSSNSSFIEKDLIIPTDHARFTKLQRIIVSLDDDELINEIADIVYATGSYQICKESQKFQFKLEDLGLKALCRIEKLVYKDD